MPLLQDVKEIKDGMGKLATKEDIKAVDEKVDKTDAKVEAIEVKVARLDVKVALGASLGSLLGGGTVALIVSQVSG